MRFFVRVRLYAALLAIGALLTLALAATDAEYEKDAQLDKAIKDGTLTSDSEIEGKSYEADKAFGQDGCKAKFEFSIAKQGTSPYGAADKTVKGVYVRINCSFDKAKCEGRCEEIKVLQVLRQYTKNDSGGKDAIAPDSPQRRERAGWNDASAASRGWYIDSLDNGPFYGPGATKGSAESGSTDKPSIERDAPGHYDGTTKKGKDFIACAVCVNAGQKSRIIACVNWGYYIDAAGKVAFDPKPPVPSGSPPQQVKDALQRFEKISGNTSANIQF